MNKVVRRDRPIPKEVTEPVSSSGTSGVERSAPIYTRGFRVSLSLAHHICPERNIGRHGQVVTSQNSARKDFVAGHSIMWDTDGQEDLVFLDGVEDDMLRVDIER